MWNMNSPVSRVLLSITYERDSKEHLWKLGEQSEVCGFTKASKSVFTGVQGLWFIFSSMRGCITFNETKYSPHLAGADTLVSAGVCVWYRGDYTQNDSI